MAHCTGLYVPFTTIFANKRKGRLSDGIKLPPFPPRPAAERNHPYFLRKPLWIFSVNQGRSARQAVQRQHPVRHFIDNTGKMRIGRAFLTMHRISDKENQIHTDMALALPAVVKDAVAIWVDMDALDRCSG